MADLTDIDTLKSLLGEKGVTPTRSAGQNFLVCREPIEEIAAALEAGPTAVTELGAGMGPLTQKLLADGFRVRAIERDEVLAGILKEQTPAELQEHLMIETTDLKAADWRWTEPYQVAGNIPYNLSGLIIRRLTQLEPKPEKVVLMVQREVALRLTAKPPEMNLPGLSIQLWGKIEALQQVPAGCFWPQPQVESEVVALTPSKKALPLEKREEVIKLAKIFFQSKRKQMAGVIIKQMHRSRAEAEKVLAAAGLRPEQRPQEASVQQWIRLEQEIRTNF